MKFCVLIFVLAVVSLISENVFSSAKNCHIKLVDDLTHYVDFSQHTDGIHNLIKAMNQAGVSSVMISGLPVIKKWSSREKHRPHYYMDDDSRVYYYSLDDVIVAHAVMSLPEKERHRFHPFLNAFNPTDKNALSEIKLMVKWYPHFWQGIGQINARHGVLTHMTYGGVATADSKALYQIYDFAAKHHMPVIIQSNIDANWSDMNTKYAKKPIYLQEVVAAVKLHPQTEFIWAHAGLDRNINVPNLVPIMRNLLQKYPNLYIDISGLAYPYIVKNDKPLKPWITLFREFPTRFTFGTDFFGKFSQYSNHVFCYRIIFNALPKKVAMDIASKNFLRLLPKYAH